MFYGFILLTPQGDMAILVCFSFSPIKEVQRVWGYIWTLYTPPECSDPLLPISKAPPAVWKTRDKSGEELMTKHGLN